MPACLDTVSEDGLLAELLARLETLEAFHQHEPAAVLPYQDGNLLAVLQNAFGKFLCLFRIERPAPLRRHVDLRDRNGFALHHERMIPKKPALGLRPEGGNRFSDKIMRFGNPGTSAI